MKQILHNVRFLYCTIIVFITFFCILSCNKNTSFDYGDMPRNRIPPNGWENITWKNPGEWKVVNVTKHGLIPNDSSINAAVKIMDIIKKGIGNRIIFLPKGTYTFKSTCEITKGGIIFKGEGKDKTVINIHCKDDGFRFKGNYNAPKLKVVGGIKRGDNKIIIDDTSNVQQGDFIRVFNSNRASLYLGQEKGAFGEYGQIVRITKKEKNTLTLDMKMAIAIPENENPMAKKADLIHNVGIKDLKIYRVNIGNEDQGQIRNIIFFHTFNGFVNKIESSYTYGWHIGLESCRNIVVSENYIHDGWVGGGGKAYGINFRKTSTKCVAINNKIERCRHHISFGRGSNHCVYAYNNCYGRLSHDNYILFHGNYNHHNLVEGNWASGNIVIDGWHREEGINNWFFRNYTTERCGDHAVNFKTPKTTIIANECSEVEYPKNQDCYVGANIIKGNINWGTLNKNIKIPASMFLSEQPDFVNKWPLYGPVSKHQK